jgi:hypothetical protein
MKKIYFIKNPALANRIDSMFLSETCFGTEFRAFYSSAERFRKKFREFSVPWNGSERNSKSLLLILFHGTEFRAFFSSVEWFGMEFQEFSVLRNSRNSAGTNPNCSVYSVFRGIIFLAEIANPRLLVTKVWLLLVEMLLLLAKV